MKQIISWYNKFGYAIVIGAIIGHGQVALAGWTGSMNATGFGKAKVNVTSSTLKSNSVSTINMQNPSAAITNTPGYAYGTNRPAGASSATVAKIKGLSGYIWQAVTTGANGDKTDNSELQGYVTPSSPKSTTVLEILDVHPEICPWDSNQVSIVYTWHWSGTDPGTAQQLKWYEYDGTLPDDFNGDVGSLPGAVWLWGTGVRTPCSSFFESESEGGGGCPTNAFFDETNTDSFCTPQTNMNFIYLVTDGVAVSLPCPISFTGFIPPIGGADASGGSCGAAVRGFKFGSTIPVKMTLKSCDGTPITTGTQTIQVSKCDNTTGSEPAIDATPTDKATTGNAFRLTSAAYGQWQFNLATKPLSKGTWLITVTLSDGTVHRVFVDLK